VEKLEVSLPAELVEGIDRVCELLGFRSREEAVVAAVRRLVDMYKVLAVSR